MHLTHKWVECYNVVVLSVAKLTPGQEGYYERSVATGIDDYYAGKGESLGVWTGRGALALGLEGSLDEGQLGALIRGEDPQTGERLRRHHPRARRIGIERIDPTSGERRLEEKTLRPVAAFDLVFSVPKSVSLLHALGGEETRRAVNEAHTAAWHAALAYLEDEACVVRKGTGGIAREHGGGFVAAAYQHRTSRAQDPHLHTHLIVANMARRPSDGKWRALDGGAILKTYRLAAGHLYEAQLRHELSRSLGVEWATPRKGWAELAGVPRSVIDEFSTRRQQVVERLDGQERAGFYAAKRAAVETRERKQHVDLGELREDWRARAAEHGLGRRELGTLLHRLRRRELSPQELLEHGRRLLGPGGLTEKTTAFSEPDLVMAWAQAHAQGADAGRVRLLSARLVKTDGVEQVGEAPQPGRPARYSTAELIAAERDALALVERGLAAGAPAISADALTQQETLSPEQQAMLRAVATSPDRIVCVVGIAGSGKTTATRAVAEAFQAAGVPVIGGAPSGVAAEKLQDETGIGSTTLHRLLRRELPERCLLVVDEAGMAETRILGPLLERVEQADGKAVLIGDPHQLPAVGAGGLFAGIVERHGAIELAENRRQHNPDERRALEAVRNGLGRDYLAFAQGTGRLVASETPLATRARLLADWWAAARDDLPGSVMIALRRRDVADLNALARATMETDGRLGAERLQLSAGEFAPGDRIVCLLNSDALGVRNGTLGTVDTVDPARRTLTLRTDRGDRAELGRAYLDLGHVRHGYALTGHSAQGVTVERAFVLGTGGQRLQEWGYVALSRAREQTRLYVTGEPSERESHFHDLDDRDHVTLLAQELEESAIERLAVDQRPLPTGPRHETRVVIDRPSEPDRTQLRLIEQQRLVLAKTRSRAQTRLTEAERELQRLGRRRRGAQLRSEIAFQERALQMTDDKLRELDRNLARPPLLPASREIRIARTRARGRIQERGIELPGLER
jgi:conjugative relaxase-like TrwC/TraI family protein